MVKEHISIYASMDGMSIHIPLVIHYNPIKENTEKAIIRTLGDHSRKFEELALKRQWNDAYWTYELNRHAVAGEFHNI